LIAALTQGQLGFIFIFQRFVLYNWVAPTLISGCAGRKIGDIPDRLFPSVR
jgi:hypothetical protein